MGLRLAGELPAAVEVGDLPGTRPAGSKPLEALFARVAEPIGTPGMAGV